jgi:hypothetical protein
MTMKHLWAAALLLAAAPAAAQTIETGSGDWSNMPEMRQQDGTSIDPDAVAAFAEMVDRGECVIAGQRAGSLDMSVPFLVLLARDGSITRLVIHPIGCARGEGLVGGAILRLVQNGAASSRPAAGTRAGSAVKSALPIPANREWRSRIIGIRPQPSERRPLAQPAGHPPDPGPGRGGEAFEDPGA